MMGRIWISNITTQNAYGWGNYYSVELSADCNLDLIVLNSVIYDDKATPFQSIKKTELIRSRKLLKLVVYGVFTTEQRIANYFNELIS